MTSYSLENLKHPKARHALLGYAAAFATTAVGFYLLASIIWPLSVSRFRTVTTITLTADETIVDQQQLLSLLVECVRQETTTDRLGQLIEQTRMSGSIRTRAFELSDYQAIASSIQVGMKRQMDTSRFQFLISFDGSGLDDEQRFLHNLSRKVANRCNEIGLTVDNQGNTIAALPRNTNLDRLERAIWLADQIESDIQTAANATSISNSQFKFASSRTGPKTASSGGDTLKQQLASIDTRSLRNVLRDVHQSIQNSNGPGPVHIADVATPQTRAINATPGRTGLIILFILSIAVGITVTWHYQPFADRGFGNVESVARTLNLPIVATVGEEHADSMGTESTQVRSWANLLVETVGLVLLGLGIVIVGFLLTNSLVRESFLHNPYDGIARMIRVFVGY